MDLQGRYQRELGVLRKLQEDVCDPLRPDTDGRYEALHVYREKVANTGTLLLHDIVDRHTLN